MTPVHSPSGAQISVISLLGAPNSTTDASPRSMKRVGLNFFTGQPETETSQGGPVLCSQQQERAPFSAPEGVRSPLFGIRFSLSLDEGLVLCIPPATLILIPD